MNLDISPLWISLKTAGLATIITFFLGLIVARLMLNFRGKTRGIIDAILISPLVLPPTVVGFLLLLLLGKNGFLGQFLDQIGIDIIFNWKATVITSIVVSFPLMYRTSLGAFEQIEPNIILAARTLGSSELTIFLQVIIPLAYRGIVAGTILAFARALGEFGATLMLAGNIPGQTQTMPLAIFFASESGDYKTALIWVLILLFISFFVIITVNFWAESKHFKQTRSNQNQKMFNLTNIIKSQANVKINHTYNVNNNSLFVNIRKSHQGFSLDVTLESNQKLLGLLGASGSGKSMTLRCIAGLETPERGLITVNGKIWFDSKRKINLPSCQRKVGFVFQNYALFPHLTVRQNIAFGVQNLPLKEQKQKVDAKIAQMQLQDLENRYPAQLSGGQQQRVALARALVIEPEVLLLDEPFSALDSQLRTQMENNLREILAIYQGTALLVSHNLEEIYRICQNILVISEGKVLSYGDKQQIFQQPHLYEVARLTGCKNFSAIKIMSNYQLKALDWDCEIILSNPISQTATHIGIRAHQILFKELESLKIKPKITNSLEAISSKSLQILEETDINTFPCWLVKNSETPHRMTLFLKVNSPPTHYHDYHFQVELFKENWQLLKDFPFPWHLKLDSQRLFLLEKY
jgi:molybdate ABC transporter permease protein